MLSLKKSSPFRTLIDLLRGKPLFNEGDPPVEGFEHWREHILTLIMAGGMLLCLPALVSAAIMRWAEGRWALMAANLFAFALSGLLLFFHRIDRRVRAAVIFLIVYSVGVLSILGTGFAGGGPAWLFFLGVLAGMFGGLRGALASTAVNAATIALLALVMSAGAPLGQALNLSKPQAFASWINFLVLNAASAVSVAILVNSLQTLNLRTQRATTELKRERAALRQSENRYRVLTESLPDVVWSMDLNLQFTYVGPRAHSMQGWTREEHLNLGLTQIMTPASIDTVKRAFAEKYAEVLQNGASGQPTSLELELLHKNGATVWAEVTASFIVGEDGKPVGILGVTRDITERRRAARERELLIESLERSKKMEALGTLAGGVAHDLNNVLSGIVSYPDMLLWDLPQESLLRKPVETIRDSGKKAAAIVQDLLTLARRGVTNPEVLSLNDLVNDHLKSPEFRQLLAFHPLVEVRTALAPGLLNLRGSAIHLSKTIMNLLSNAAEAMSEGGLVTVATENVTLERPIQGYADVVEGPYVRLQVSDTGVGISAEDLQRIFEPFYTKKKMGRSGTGLGMAVVWGTVQDHHGYIDVRSTQGAGTTIEIFFPATSREATPKENIVAFESFRGRGEKILVVDDVKEQRELLTCILSQLGYVHECAASGEEAVAYMASNSADLVILDMIMDPGIDGLETYRRILEYHPRQKAIITSGFAETDRVKRAHALGTGAYVKKPYTVEELANALRAELDRPGPPV